MIARLVAAALVLSVVVGVALGVAGVALDDRRMLNAGIVVLLASTVGHVGISVLALGYATPQTVPGWRVLLLTPQLLVSLVISGHGLATRNPASLPAALSMFALTLVLVGVVASDLPRWRAPATDDPAGVPRRPPSWCTYRPALWRGQTRAATVLLIGGHLVTPLVAVTWSATLFGWPAVVAERAETAVTASVLGVAIVAVLATSIVLVNRPRWLVPPHLRHEPGLLAEPTSTSS